MVTATTVSLIDNIFCNELSTLVTSGILEINISDHFPVFCKTQYGNTIGSEKMSKRLIKKFNTSESNTSLFRQKLQNIVWDDMMCNDLNVSYSKLFTVITRVYNECFPSAECSQK